MHPSAILHEVQQLHSVSDRLDLLAEQHLVSSNHHHLGKHSQHGHGVGGASRDENSAPIFGSDPASP